MKDELRKIGAIPQSQFPSSCPRVIVSKTETLLKKTRISRMVYLWEISAIFAQSVVNSVDSK